MRACVSDARTPPVVSSFLLFCVGDAVADAVLVRVRSRERTRSPASVGAASGGYALFEGPQHRVRFRTCARGRMSG